MWRQATSQSTMTCMDIFPKLRLWYIYNCTMSSSYTVRALFVLIKQEDSLSRLDRHRPDCSCLWQSQCVMGEWDGQKRGRFVRAWWDYLHLEDIKFFEWSNLKCLLSHLWGNLLHFLSCTGAWTWCTGDRLAFVTDIEHLDSCFRWQ